MMNGAGARERKLPERLAEALRAHPAVLTGALCAAGAFLSAMARIAGEAAPFGVSFVAAVPLPLLLPAALGAAAGYLAAGLSASYRCCGALLLAAALRVALQRVLRDRRAPVWASPAVAAACVLIAGIAPVFYTSPLAYDWIMWATQVVMAGAAASFMLRAFEGGLTLDPGTLLRADRLTRASAVVLAGVALMGLDAVTLSGVSLGRIAAALAVLAAARVGGERASALCGVVAGLVIGFSTGEFEVYVTSYGIGGLLAGVFSAFGKKGSAVVFALCYGAFGLLAQRSPAGFIEVAAAAGLFLLLPEKWYGVFAAARPAAGDGAFREIAAQRISAVSGALREVSDTTREVAERLSRRAAESPEAICRRACRTACRRCPYTEACWKSEPGVTLRALQTALALLRQTGELRPESLPRALSRCPNKDKLAEALTEEYEAWSQREERRTANERERALLAEQYDGVGMALDALAERIGSLKPATPATAQSLCSIFAAEGLEPRRVLCWKDETGRVSVRAALPRRAAGSADGKKLAEALGEAAGVRFLPPTLTVSAQETTLEFVQRPAFRAVCGSCQITAGKERCCGDTLRRLEAGGMVHLLLSDGMGTGRGAALDSTLAASLATCLLEADVDYQSALRLVNSALMVRSAGESLATLDAVRLDCYSGVVSFYKAGAAPTLMLRAGKVTELSSGSLPAGILEGVAFETAQFRLAPGDAVLLMSDGASQEGCQWLKPMLEGLSGDLDAFCKRAARLAQLRRLDGREDDITVAVLRVEAIDAQP